MRAILAILLMTIIGYVSAQPQQPLHQPQAQTEIKSAPSEKGTENTKQPLQKIVSPPPSSTDQTPVYTSNSLGPEVGTEYFPVFCGIRLKITDALLVVFTFLLAIFTFLLWHSTDKLWSESKEATASAKQAANAARLSAEALTLIEKAYVFAEIHLQNSFASTPSGDINTRITVLFRNHGKTPAIMTKIRAYLVLDGTVPKELIKTPYSDREIPPGLIISSADDYELSLDYGMTDEKWDQIQRLEQILYCVGLLEYLDVLGDKRETGFCWEYVYHSAIGHFVISPGTDLNHYS